MAYNAGDVEAKLELDRSPFITGLKTSLAEAEAWKKKAEKALKPAADIDQKPFTKALTAMQARLVKFAAKTYTAKVRIDDVGQLPKLTEMTKRLNSLGQRVVKPKVSVEVDDAALKKVQTQLAAISKLKPTITLDLDLSEFQSKYASAEAMLNRLDRTVKVNFEFGDARKMGAELAAIDALLESVTRQRTIYIDLDLRNLIADAARVMAIMDMVTQDRTIKINATADTTRAMLLLDILERQVDRLNRKTVSIDTRKSVLSLSLLTKAFGGASRAGMRTSGSMFSAANRFKLLAGAITVLAAPAVGTITTLLATLPFVAGAAALSIGTVTSGIVGLRQATQPLVDAFNALAPPIEAIFRNGLEPMVNQLLTLMPMLGAAMQENAKILVDWAGAITNVVMEYNRMGLIKQLLDNINAGMRALQPLVDQAMRTFMTFMVVAGQTFGSLVSVLNEFATRFNEMVQQAAATGVLAEAFRQLANVVGSLLYMWTELFRVGFQMMAELGPGLSTFFRTLTDLFVALAPILTQITQTFMAVFTPVMQGLIVVFQNLTPALVLFGEMLGTLVGGSVTAIMPLLDALSNVLGIVLMAALKAIQPLIPVIIDGFTMLAEALTPIANQIGPILVDVINELAPLFPVLAQAFADILKAVIPLIPQLLQLALKILPYIPPVIGFIVDGFILLVPAIVAVVTWVANLVSGFLDFINWITNVGDRITELKGIWETVWGGIGNFFSTVWDGIVNFITVTIPGAWNSLVTGAQNAVTAVGQWFAALPQNIAFALGAAIGAIIRWGVDVYQAVVIGWQATKDWFANLPYVVATFFVQAGTWLYQAGLDIIGGASRGISNAWVAVGNWFRALPGNLLLFFVNAGLWLYQTGVDLLNGLSTGISNGWTGLIAWFVTLPARIGAFFVNAKNWLLQTGIDIIGGLWLGIENAWYGFTAWIFGLFDSFIQGVKSGLGIASPSTVFAGIGGDIMRGLINGIAALGQWLYDTWNGLWTNVYNFFANAWTNLYNTAMDYWNLIKIYYDQKLAEFGMAWSNFWNSIWQFFTNLWTNLYNTVMFYWNLIKIYYDTKLTEFQNFWFGVWEAIRLYFVNKWNELRDWAARLWEALKIYYEQRLQSFQDWWSQTWENIKNGFRSKFEGIIQIAKDIWQNVKDVFRGGINAIINGVNWPIDKINGLFGISIPRLPEIPPLATGGNVQDAMGGPVRGPGGPTQDRVLARLSNGEHVWSASEVAAAGGHDAVRKMRSAVLNGNPNATPAPVQDTLASRLNNPRNMGSSMYAGYQRLKLMDRFPRMDGIGQPLLAYGGVKPHVAAAGQEIERVFGRMPGGIGGVGQRSNASDHPSGHALDFMTMSNSGLGDRIAGYLSQHWARMQIKYLIWKQRIANQPNAWRGMENRGSVTANHFDHVHASFLGGPGGGGGFSIDYGAIFDMIAGPFKGVGENFLRGLIPNPPLPNWIEDMGVGFYNKAWDGLRKKTIELISAMGFGGGGGGNVEQWRPQVLAALQRVGQPASMADITLRRMDQESSGNPRAINNWDINALRGWPTKGLMQMRDDTYQSHRDPGLVNNIWDPLSNITASMRYALSRYGSLPAAYNKRGGYDEGGMLPQGWSLAFNGTGAPEPVLTSPQWGALMDTAVAARELVVQDNNGGSGLSAADVERIISKLAEMRPLIGNLQQQLPHGVKPEDMIEELGFELRHIRKGTYE